MKGNNMVDIRESLNDQIFISSFTDPASAVEATQGSQTYSFRQSKDTYLNNEDQQWLDPKPDPDYVPANPIGTTNILPYIMPGTAISSLAKLIYKSVDGFNFSLQPTQPLNDRGILSPESVINVIENVNDHIPISRRSYQKNFALRPLETTATNVRNWAVPAWQLIREGKYQQKGQRSGGHAL
jgi:hypothetical protein